MIKWFFYWDEWRKAYWGLIEKHPELFVFLHRMYVFQHHQMLAPQHKNPSPQGVKEKSILSKGSETSKYPAFDSSSERKNLPQSDLLFSSIEVLFDAFAARETCLGVGEKLVDRIKGGNSKISVGFYQNARRVIIPSNQHRGSPVVTLKIKPTLKGILRFLQLLPVVYWFGLKSNTVAKYIVCHPLKTSGNLLKITITAACMERMLDQVNPRVILSCNEQGGADSSLLFALGKKKGIRTIQYMHAVPTKQFVPFICDEYWSWSELTTRMLMGDEENSRVINMGSLEHESRAPVAREDSVAAKEGFRVLFLSQLGLDEAWGINAFSKGVSLFKEAVSGMDNLTIRIRLHPSITEERKCQIEEIYRGLTYELTTKETALEDDVKWASHVYTVCSNAVFAALHSGKPAFLIWNKELDEIYGRAFLPDENIIGDHADLIASLSQFKTENSGEETFQKIIGQPGALDRAVERLSLLVDSVC